MAAFARRWRHSLRAGGGNSQVLINADRSARFFLKCPQRPSSMVYTVKVHLQRTLADLMFPPHCQSGRG